MFTFFDSRRNLLSDEIFIRLSPILQPLSHKRFSLVLNQKPKFRSFLNLALWNQINLSQLSLLVTRSRDIKEQHDGFLPNHEFTGKSGWNENLEICKIILRKSLEKVPQLRFTSDVRNIETPMMSFLAMKMIAIEICREYLHFSP